MGVAINYFAVREMVGLFYGATSLFTTCSVLEIWWLKLQLKSCSEMGVPVLRLPEHANCYIPRLRVQIAML